MKKYIVIQGKRVIRYMPGAFCVILALLILLGMALSVMLKQDAAGEENRKFRIGVTGCTDDLYVKTAINAMGSYDSMQYSLDMVYMSDEQARAAIKSGDIAAYIVIPEEFVSEAFNGKLIPIQFVSRTGAAGLVSVFKEEITDVIANIFVETQKGVFGLYDAMTDNGITEERIERINELNIECIDYIFIRDGVYAAEEIGLTDALDLSDYLLCGFVVLFMLFACLPFSPLLIRRESSLERMLAAKGRPLALQAICEFAVYAAALLIIVFGAVLAGGAALSTLAPDVLTAVNGAAFLLRLLPVWLITATMSYMLYTAANDLIGGVLLQFLITLAMCFVSGCMYPVYFFPQAVQEAAVWLPTGLARTQLASAFNGQYDWTSFVVLIAYSALFLCIGIALRIRSVRRECE